MIHPHAPYFLAFRLLDGIGQRRANRIISRYADVKEAFEAPLKDWKNVDLINSRILSKLNRNQALDLASIELERAKKNGWRVICQNEDDFPRRLKHCVDSPLILFGRGEANLNPERIVSFVGTRRASEYGKKICAEFMRGLREYRVTTVSGLALGIDTCIHKESLINDLPTIAVIGTGLDRIYPASNRQLAANILENGMILTEFPSQTNPDRENFPQRNRLVAGMTDATVVIESAKSGGALITADLAFSYNRDVFAVPGRIGDVFSEGCNNLIRTHRGALIQSPRDLAYVLGWDAPVEKPKAQRQLFIDLSPSEELVVEKLQENGAMHIDQLSALSDHSISESMVVLTGLEVKGLVKSLPGSRYGLI